MYKFLIISREDFCLAKTYASHCSFDCGFYCLKQQHKKGQRCQ